MEKLNSINIKILNNKSSRSWDIRVAQLTENLDAALLYGQIAHHHKYMGDFSKSNEELAQELNFSIDMIKRTKKLLINKGFVSISNGSKNKTTYSVVKKLDYCEKSYRKYDINHCIINKNTNAGILLSQLIYCHEHFFKKGHAEFFKTNECLMKELYLSPWQLNESKKKLVKNGFIMTGIGQHGRTYYKINMNKIKEAIRIIPVVTKLDAQDGQKGQSSSDKTRRAVGAKPGAQLVQNQAHNT